MKQSIVRSLGTGIRRATSPGLPTQAEIERYGADGEEAICRLLRDHFECVIRNVIVPHKDKYLEKDFLVVFQGVPFVIEVKAWKGVIGKEGDTFYQNKTNGTRKTIKSPVGTTAQFLSCMQKYYSIERPVYGIVVFADPDCTLALPDELEGIALVKADKLIDTVKARVKAEIGNFEDLDTDRILRSTRFYSVDEEFCKGMLVEDYLDLYDKEGREILLDTTKLRFITVERQSLRLRDKLYVTYLNGDSDVFFNRDVTVTVACLDGTFRKIALNRIRYIVF
ncbi:MAG: NERD domain-containing protein [Clostridia bacterium]|nr:NERD domain-containing protein [Clostridia bacterium]